MTRACTPTAPKLVPSPETPASGQGPASPCRFVPLGHRSAAVHLVSLLRHGRTGRGRSPCHRVAAPLASTGVCAAMLCMFKKERLAGGGGVSWRRGKLAGMAVAVLQHARGLFRSVTTQAALLRSRATATAMAELMSRLMPARPTLRRRLILTDCLAQNVSALRFYYGSARHSSISREQALGETLQQQVRGTRESWPRAHNASQRRRRRRPARL